MVRTLKPGTLVIASAYPDPPFELADSSENGFDVDFDASRQRATGAELGADTVSGR
jgi:hypothetical protein